MSAHSEDEVSEFTRLIRAFITGVRAHLSQLAEDGDPETVEKFFAAVAAVGAAVLLLIPGKRKEGLLSGLLAALARFVSKRQE